MESFGDWKLTRGECSSKLLSVSTSHERKLYSRSRTNDQFIVSVYRVYFVNIDGILYWYMKRSILYEGDWLRLNTYACYSWEMTLNVGVDNGYSRKWTRGKAGDVNSTNRWWVSHWILNGYCSNLNTWIHTYMYEYNIWYSHVGCYKNCCLFVLI
jgi:hypothetical protein